MKLTTDAKRTILLEDVPVGKLVKEGNALAFYVPGDGRFNQCLLHLNGIRFPQANYVRSMDTVMALRSLLECKE